MWILENDGDALNGKKLWLRPGKKFLFGRQKPKDPEDDTDEQLFIVSDKTISRKHLIVEVSPIEPGACAKPRTKSRLTITDLKTKIGTLLNGEQIRGTSRVLDKDKNDVTVGKYENQFHFTWVPVTFTFSFTSKEERSNPYESLYEKLGPLDIKVLDEYQRGVTTHVVAKKRNTPKGLQALIDGKLIVHNDSFINAILEAAEPADGGSQLELDFEGKWPKESEYLPPKGGEPTPRPEEAYAPNPLRQDMFEGYTFVFYEKKQFETLLAPITSGRGKALLRLAVPDETTVDDFVRYVKGVAGEKGLGSFDDGSEGKGVVVVRFNPVKGPGTEWFAQFGTEVALHLDHRLIEQNEFLDAILGNDASVLRRPLEVESSGIAAPPPTLTTLRPSQPIQSTEPVQSIQAAPVPSPVTEEAAPPETSRRGRSRRTARTQFKGLLDDDFSGPLVMHSIPESMQVDSMPAPLEQPELEPEPEPQSQGLFVTQDPDMDIHREPSQPPETQIRSSRKRAATPLFDQDIMEEMAPTTAALKRRRLADELERKRRGEPSPSPPPAPALVVKKEEPKTPAKTPPKRSRKIKEATPDLVEEARKRREEEEAIVKAEREAVEARFDGMDISEIRADVQIVEIEVKRSKPPPRRVNTADESERWDDKWNGRKNFKRFRRRGAGDNVRARGLDKVIVPLEEVKTKDYGIGDDYWEVGDPNQRKKRKGKGKEMDTQTQNESGQSSRPQSHAAKIIANEISDDDDTPISRPSVPRSQARASIPVDPDQNSDVEIVERPEVAAKSKVTASASRTSQSQSQRLTEKSQNSVLASPKKRVAPTALSKPAPAKKAKTALRAPREDSDDDSDDALKFKFKKKEVKER